MASMDLIGSAELPAAEPFDTAARDLGFTAKTSVDDDDYEGLVQMYGAAFPLLHHKPSEDDWVKWAESLWERHTAAMQARLHLVERNRLFRKGVQWISSVGMGPWREPERPRDAARVVRNKIKPALDQRIQLLSEQRPGFRCRPNSQDPKDLRKAEAQQIALEYQWAQQDMSKIIGEAAFWSGTDGVSFLEVYWDPNRGEWREAYGVNDASGLAQPLDESGQPTDGPAHAFPVGDLATRVRRIEHVRVSADAKATKRPWYWVIREAIPAALAAHEYGAEAAAEMATMRPESRIRLGTVPAQRLGFLLPEEDELFREQEIVDRVTIYCEPSEYLPKGLMLIAVGGKLQFLGPLLWGCVPMVRFTDGSADPAFFPEAIMDSWVDSQMRINAVLSKWVENVRLNAGPRLIAREDSLSSETLVGGTMSIISVKGLGSINESVKPLEGFSLAEDALKLIEDEEAEFEKLSGWNDGTRGSFTGDPSGRAVLAIRESVERIFAPLVNSAADSMVEWAKINLCGMAWGYDLARDVAVEGKTRADLAFSLIADDFDGVTHVFVDPETLMPMTRSMRLFLLQQMRSTGDITPQEYRRRLPFAWIREIGSPDEDQEARARRCAEALRHGQTLPILWQDNEAIHQDVLERELILPDDTDPQTRQMAQQRWQMLAQQAAQKAQMMAPPPTPPGAAPAQGAPNPLGPSAPTPAPPMPPGMYQPASPGGLPPGQQPFSATNPSIAAAQNPIAGTPGVPGGAVLAMGGRPDAEAAAREFDARNPY